MPAVKRSASKSAAAPVFTEAELADHWGVTARRVRQLAEADIAVRVRGGYDAIESDRRFIAELRQDELGRDTRQKTEALRASAVAMRCARNDRTTLRPDELQKAIQKIWGMFAFGASEWRSEILLELDRLFRNEPRREALIHNFASTHAALVKKVELLMLTEIGIVESELREEVASGMRTRWIEIDGLWPGAPKLANGGDDDARDDDSL